MSAKEKEERLNARASAPAQREPQKLTTRLSWKGDLEFRHDLFKLLITDMKKNTSYKAFDPKLEEVPHVHFFHSHDMKGKQNVHCQAVGGHFHEVTIKWGEDKDGNLVILSAECGPPLRIGQKRLRNGKVKSLVERVRFKKAVDPEDEDDPEYTYLVDDHRHEIEYRGSEMISPAKLRQQREADKAKLAQMLAAQPSLASTTEKAKPGETAGDDEPLDGADAGNGAKMSEA